jgi:hypothetical protein
VSAENETLAEKQQRLSADIARQRTQLAAAYRDIAKPVLYAEYGLRGFGFLRQNPWILTIVPASLSTTTSLIALVRNFIPAKAAPKKAKWFGRAGRGAEREVDRDEKRAKKSLLDHAKTWGGHGWKAYKLFKRVRKYFP